MAERKKKVESEAFDFTYGSLWRVLGLTDSQGQCRISLTYKRNPKTPPPPAPDRERDIWDVLPDGSGDYY